MTTNPAIQFVFFKFQQPTTETWEKFERFVHQWNEVEQIRFGSEMPGEWFITFEKGLDDPAIPRFRVQLEELNRRDGVVWFVGIKDERKGIDFEKSPLIEIYGDGYPDGFIINESDAFGASEKCPECGDSDNTFRKVIKPIIIDENYLKRKEVQTDDDSVFATDLIGLPNAGMLISAKVLTILKDQKIRGFRLEQVVSKQSMLPSDKYFLIIAEQAILRPCSIHTLVTESGICSSCGRIFGGLLTSYTVCKEWLNGADIFSRHPYRYARIYVTDQLYSKLKQKKVKGLEPIYGIAECTHLNP